VKKKSVQLSRRYFPMVPLADVGHRAGKHHKIVSDVLSDLSKLDQYSAIKIDLKATGQQKAPLRAALLRAARKVKIRLATSSDEKHLYVFRSPLKSPPTNSGSPD